MATIYLPIMAAFKDDVKTMFGLLEKTVSAPHEIGLEIIGKPEHFVSERSSEWLDKIKENIGEIAKGAHIAVHGFSGLDVYETGIADMRTEDGLNLLQTYLQLTQNIGAEYVHVHSAAGYKEDTSFREKEQALSQIRKNMLEAQARHPNILIGIENLPVPSMGDVEINPKKVWKDYVESLGDCLSVTQGTPLKITFDTCHHACGYEKQVDLVNEAKKIRDYLHHLHVSDVQGRYIPHKSTWTEGIIPGEGRIGKEAFKDFFKYTTRVHPNIGICAEVSNNDFKNPVESEQTIERILGWLN